jgi:hypothetical protein
VSNRKIQTPTNSNKLRRQLIKELPIVFKSNYILMTNKEFVRKCGASQNYIFTHVPNISQTVFSENKLEKQRVN